MRKFQMIRPTQRCWQQNGFTYLAVIFAVAVMGIWLAAVVQVWATASKRDKENQLLWNGNEIRKAIGSYYERSPGNVKKFPPSLENLLHDYRFPATQRHLRKRYPDPFSENGEWALLALPNGEIYGVASKSQLEPIKKDNFTLAN